MQKRSLYSITAVVMALVIVFTIAFGSARPVQAAEIRESGVLNANETIDDDLIISGDQVRVDGTVNGMLIATGRTVTVNGKINGDALLFGETIIVSDKAVIDGNLFSGARDITVNGEVTGSIAGGSSSMVVSSNVGRNIYYGGYSLETQPGNAVARGLYFGGYQAMLNGSIARDLQAGAGAVELNGSVGNDAVIRVAPPNQRTMPVFIASTYEGMPPRIPTGLRIGPEAEIGGQLIYTSEANQNTAVQAAPAGGIVYQTPLPQERSERPDRPAPVVRAVSPVVNWLIDFMREFITLLVLGLLAVWLLPVVARRTGEIAREKPVQSAGWGLLTIIVGYILAFIVALFILGFGLFLTLLTLGGLSSAVFGIGFSGLALVVTVFTLLVGYASKLVIAYLVGDLILAGTAPEVNGRRYWAIVIGVLLYALIQSIPFLGWLIELLVILTGVGAMWLYYRSLRAPAAPAPVSIEPAA